MFKGDSYIKDFFNRHDDDQRGLPLSDARNIQREWGLSVPKDRQTIGFKDIIADEYGISGL